MCQALPRTTAKAPVAAQRQQPFTCGARTVSQHIMDGGDAVDFVMAIYDVAEDMEADDVMCNLSRQDLDREHWMLTLSDSESDSFLQIC